MRRLSCIVIVLATRAGAHEAANLRALVSWPTGGRRVCLAPASMGTVLDRQDAEDVHEVAQSARCKLFVGTGFV
jgi:hypothetical protein